jgi:hypothetical protein
MEQHALIDNVGAAAHGGYGAFCAIRPTPPCAATLNFDDSPPFATESLKPSALVFKPLRRQKIRMGIAGTLNAEFALTLELDQVLAFQEVV